MITLLGDEPIFYGSMQTLLGSSGTLFPSDVSGVQKNDNVPTLYNWSFGIQRAFGFGTLLGVSYVGNIGRHLIERIDLNTLPFGARFLPQNADPTNPSRALPDNFFRPFPGYGAVTYNETAGTSNYNALEVKLERRFRSGVQFAVAYTFSKAMGVASEDGTNNRVSRYIARKVWNYGPLAFDQTHVLVANYMWDLPKLGKRLRNPLVHSVFDDCQLAGITTFAGAIPQSVGLSTTDGADLTGGGDGTRPLVIAEPQLARGSRSFAKWFNTSAFARPPRGSFGNAANTSFRGPGINNWNLNLMKEIPLQSEKRFLRFRCEMYNAFNHAQFSGVDSTARFDPQGNQVNGRFGQVTSTRDARIIQLSLNLVF